MEALKRAVYLCVLIGKNNETLQKQTGAFNITSTPEGAQVFIGGQYKGITPLSGSMEVGQYEVEAKLDGYTASKQDLSVSKTGINELSFSLRDLSELPKIGELFGGGIVFNVDESGHGLIISMQEVGWFNWRKSKSKCKSYEHKGHKDWYLPLKYEIQKLTEVKKQVNNSLVKEGGSVLKSAYYWTSTQDDDSYRNAFISFGTLSFSRAKDFKAYARPVRAF